jgi:predicted ABC-type transport system involved in lysophospholipase L1 biosynthesis ATPase subunit
MLDLQADTGTALVVVSHDRGIGDGFDDVRRLADGRLLRADGVDEPGA